MTDETVEISRSQLALLQQTAQLTKALWDDPKHGMMVKEAAKDKFPDAVIPEVDTIRALRKTEESVTSRIDAATKALEDRLAASEKALKDKEDADAEAKETKKFAKAVDATKKKYQLTPEGMEKVFARMKEMNNPDVEAAAAWVTDHQAMTKPTDVSNYSPSDMNLYGSGREDAEWAELNKNPLRWGSNEIAQMADDFANGRQGKYREFGGTL